MSGNDVTSKVECSNHEASIGGLSNSGRPKSKVRTTAARLTSAYVQLSQQKALFLNFESDDRDAAAYSTEPAMIQGCSTCGRDRARIQE